MNTITWKPGSDTKLDDLFDSLREKQHQDRSHRLWKNYSLEYWNDAGIIANTICFDKNNTPEVCSTISSRPCWPVGVFRIYNRTWKCSNKKQFLRTVTPAMALAGKSQIEWLETYVNSELYFISRETDNWQEWMINSFYNTHAMEFKMDNYLYLTCPNDCDNSCWQKIIYNGKEDLLKQWQRKVI